MKLKLNGRKVSVYETFGYTGDVQTFTAQDSADYKLQVWGASGGNGTNGYSKGGYGGYSEGTIHINAGETVYIYVGGAGTGGSSSAAGYNGGGYANHAGSWDRGGGGGATHIAKVSGLLNTLSENQSDILIVAGGGGGAGYYQSNEYGTGGSGGGFKGGNGVRRTSGTAGNGATQSSGGTGYQSGSFGQGANRTNSSDYGGSGGGGGFYGGGASSNTCGAGGGSGYFNSAMQDGCMYGYGVDESSDPATKTVSVNVYNADPVEKTAKSGNGYAIISCDIFEGDDYDRLKNIDFVPETDIIGKSIPINRFTVDVQTNDMIEPNTLVYLLDNTDNIWAYYWITDTYYVEKGWLHIIAQSTMVLLDRYTMPAKMYDGTESFGDVIAEIFQSIQTMFPSMNVVTIDPSLASTVISGYAPEQKARERLLWVLFCARAYVKSFFNSCTEILPVDTTETLVPADKTFWKPEVKANDYVTEIKVRAYTYTLTTTDPARTDKFVKVGNDVYIETAQDFSLQNQNIPITVAENVVNLQKVTLVNANNVNSILSDLAEYYFNRYSVSAEFINNGEFLPGEKVIVSDTQNLYAGYIKSAQFTFGHNAKSAVEMQATNPIEADTLTIECVYDNTVLAEYPYLLPTGYAFSIENQYLDLYNDGVRTIYRPENEYATGTVASGGTTQQEPYEVAIIAEEFIVQPLIVSSVSESDGIVSIA